jgi:hypothetical protein
MQALRSYGPAKLLPSEQARIRTAADALLFCESIVTDGSARTAFSDVAALCDQLVESGRWSTESTDELTNDLWASGPGLGAALAAAA